MHRPRWSALSLGLVVLLYLICIGGLTMLMWQARRRAIADASRVESREKWEQWRREAERQASGGGPVLRRAPQTSQPPETIWLRDHFVTALLGMISLSSALFFTLVMMVRGACLGPRFDPSSGDDDAIANYNQD